MAALLLLGLLAWGCTLSPDDAEPSSMTFRINVRLDDQDKSRRADLIDDLEFLSARAVVSSLPDGLPAGCEDVCEPACLEEATRLDEARLEVSLVEGDDEPHLVLAGDLVFQIDSPGSVYRLDVELLERGRIVEGLYVGSLVLDSGLEAVVDSLTLSDLIPDDFTIDHLQLCLDSDAVELAPEDRCVDESDHISGTWDPDVNAMVMSYTRSEIEIEGVEADSVLVRLDAALQPAPIYRGCAEIPHPTPGSDTVDIDLLLIPDPFSGPGRSGEMLRGELTMSLFDDQGDEVLTETGRLTTVRRDALPTIQR